MNIQGFQTLTLLDFPQKVACTIFTGGCNFRCPFCHNASLVLTPNSGERFSEEVVLAHLARRKGLIDGICISGGEPMLQSDLREFILKVREMGVEVKLDTNGAYPDRLRRFIDEGILDYVAMDIKSSPNNYPEAIGCPSFDLSPIKESVSLLMEGALPFEFRTTVVRGLHTERDFAEIGEWIRGDEKYYLQSFVNSGDLIGSGMESFTPDEMRHFADILREFVPRIELRGV